MDLITPARTWVPQENDPDAPHDVPVVEHLAPIPLIGMLVSVCLPIIGLVTAIILLWHRKGIGIGWGELIALGVMYALAGFGVTLGYHRLLTHRSFDTYRFNRLLLAVLGSSAGQGMAIRWCATHRRHHQQSDRNGDPHSPHLHGDGFWGRLRGIYHAHVGWTFLKDSPDLARSVADLSSDPAMLRIDQLYLFWVILGILLPGVAFGLIAHSWHGLFAGMIWGGLVRICLMQHVTWSVNSVCHVWGQRPYRSSDYSTNNYAVAILSLGEGWHNNHHAFPTSARHGLSWWQFDASWVVLVILKSLGLVWDVRLPSEEAKVAKMIKPKTNAPAIG